jgi:anti-sigma B factor antagonist
VSDAGTLTIDVDLAGPVRIVRVSGEVDLATAPILEEALKDFAAGGDPVVVDLSAVGFLDSSGLSVLVQARQRLEEADGTNGLRLVVTRPVIRRVFEVTGLADVFTLVATLDEATRDS